MERMSLSGGENGGGVRGDCRRGADVSEGRGEPNSWSGEHFRQARGGGKLISGLVDVKLLR